jgi:hypothetical protein
MKQNDQSNEKYTVNKIHGAPNTTFKDGKFQKDYTVGKNLER